MLFGIVGLIASGKDLAYEYLKEMGVVEKRYAFADVLKDIAKMLWKSPTRSIYQKIGMAMRSIDKAVWVNYVLTQWHADGQPNAVITDVRFINEADMIQKEAGVIIGLECPSKVRYGRAVMRGRYIADLETWIEWSRHPSETEPATIMYQIEIGDRKGYLIDTNCSREEFRKQLRGICIEMELLRL